MLPDSGRSARLTTAPPLESPWPVSVRAGDGGWWVSGKDPATGRWALATSRDAGRTWSVSLMPHFEGTRFLGLTVTAAPNALYATAVGELPDVKNGLLAIFRSTDGGRTWERTWRATTGKEPRGLNGVAVARADGLLLVQNETGPAYASADGGRSFGKPQSGCGYVEWAHGGYFATSGAPSNVYYYSPDGIDWTGFTVG